MAGVVDYQVGQAFNPYKHFPRFMIIPEVVSENMSLTLAEKMVWGKLSQFSGPDNNCFPSHNTIAKSLG